MKIKPSLANPGDVIVLPVKRKFAQENLNRHAALRTLSQPRPDRDNRDCLAEPLRFGAEFVIAVLNTFEAAWSTIDDCDDATISQHTMNLCDVALVDLYGVANQRECDMVQQHLIAECGIEKVSADELIDGILTISGRFAQGVIVQPPGDGPDRPLSWSVQEVDGARLRHGSERAEACTNAVLNARRALACLVDWYVSRDLADLCQNPPGSPREKAEFLIGRGIIDELTSRVLERAIGKRNRVEHEYKAPELSEVEDVVELIRRIIETVRQQSDPSHGPWMYGLFVGGYSVGEDQVQATFGGWAESLVVFSRFEPRPWVGIVIPEDDTRALIRHTYLKEVTLDQLLHLLSLAEQRFGRPSSIGDAESSQVMSLALGFGAAFGDGESGQSQ